ncbi:MAG: hypothetical protein ACK54P_16025 [Bacteroidota bacterium]
MGNRIAKHIYTDNAFTLLEKSTYYVRDASGNVMAVYDRIIDASVETGEFMLSERHIYGSSRIGMDVSTHVFGPDPYTALTETTRELGHKQYEISNHLGNVLSVITDQKLPVEVGSLIVSYSAVVVTATDYSPFGVGLYGRSWSGEYRYGFNGQEEVVENSPSRIFFENRVYNSNLGHWLSIDQYYNLYPSLSPYSAFACNPIITIDIAGDKLRITVAQPNADRKIEPSDLKNENIARADIYSLLPDDNFYQSMLVIETDGTVSFNISEEMARSSNDPGVILLFELTSASEEYLFTVNQMGSYKRGPNGPVETTDLGFPLQTDSEGNEFVVNNQVLNLSSTPKTNIQTMGMNNRTTPDCPMDPTVAGEVIIAPETNYIKENTPEQATMNRSAVVFHELREVYERSHHGRTYRTENGVLGAHDIAISEGSKFQKGDHRHTETPGEAIISDTP